MLKRRGEIVVLLLASLGLVLAPPLPPASAQEEKQGIRPIDSGRTITSEQALEAVLQFLAEASPAERRLLSPKGNPCLRVVNPNRAATRADYRRCIQAQRTAMNCPPLSLPECAETLSCRGLPLGQSRTCASTAAT